MDVDRTAAITESRVLAEKQQADGWYCYGCARWLPAGTGSVRQERHKAYFGLYCKGGCDHESSIDPRFACRREGHVPAVRFSNMKASGVDVPSSYFTSCVRCGEEIEVELLKEAGTYGDA